jgi:hypothetical protein
MPHQLGVQEENTRCGNDHCRTPEVMKSVNTSYICAASTFLSFDSFWFHFRVDW